MNASEMLRAYDELLEGGGGASILLACDQQEATDFRAFCYRNGIEVEVRKEAAGVYRFDRCDREVRRAKA